MLFSLKILFCVIHWMNLLLLNFYIMNPTILTFIYDIPQWNKSFILNFFPLFSFLVREKESSDIIEINWSSFVIERGKKFYHRRLLVLLPVVVKKYTFFLMWNEFLTLILLCGCFVWIEFFWDFLFIIFVVKGSQSLFFFGSKQCENFLFWIGSIFHPNCA